MIMRTWTGWVHPDNADEYLSHQNDTGVREYRSTEGNLGVLVIQRPDEDLVEITTVSLWRSMDDVRSFAGDEPEKAKFYPGDDDLLARKDDFARHFEVTSGELVPGLLAH